MVIATSEVRVCDFRDVIVRESFQDVGLKLLCYLTYPECYDTVDLHIFILPEKIIVSPLLNTKTCLL